MISKHVLLTGAGFTHNFGTPLADEMWSAIFNDEQIQAEHNIKNLMKSNCNYEKIYNIIMEESYTKNEKEAFNNTIYSAYENIDSIIIDYFTRGNKDNILHDIRTMIGLFSNQKKKSFFFTLNQDLFIERFYSPNSNHIWMKPNIPGIKNKYNWFSRDFSKPLEPSDYCPVPNKVELNDNPDSLDGNFFYVKLHGSCNWTDSNGKRLILTGSRKAEQIQNESLLAHYLKIFEGVLFQPEQRLLIIGYGFGDKHINKIIANAVKNHGLELFIISPKSPNKFWKDLLLECFGDDIWQGLCGYYPYKLTDIIPNFGLYGHQFKNIFNNYFNEEKIIR